MHRSVGLGIGQVFTTAVFARLEQMPGLQLKRLRREKSSTAGRIRQVGLGAQAQTAGKRPLVLGGLEKVVAKLACRLDHLPT
jgi:hypothetical protein